MTIEEVVQATGYFVLILSVCTISFSIIFGTICWIASAFLDNCCCFKRWLPDDENWWPHVAKESESKNNLDEIIPASIETAPTTAAAQVAAAQVVSVITAEPAAGVVGGLGAPSEVANTQQPAKQVIPSESDEDDGDDEDDEPASDDEKME